MRSDGQGTHAPIRTDERMSDRQAHSERLPCADGPPSHPVVVVRLGLTARKGPLDCDAHFL